MSVDTEQPGRRWWILGIILVLGVGAGATLWVLNRTEALLPAAPDTGTETVAAEFIDVDLTWSPQATTIGGFSSVAVLGTDGAFYALSTSPSMREMPADGSPPDYSIYRSEDGATWTEQPIDGLGTELWLRNLAQADGNLYVVSTAPSVADPDGSAISVGVSGDGGGSWSSSALQLDAREPVNLGQIFGKSVQPHVAAASPFVVATASTRFFVDYNALVPPGILTDSSFAQRTSAGIEVIQYSQRGECTGMLCPAGGNQPQVVWRASWAELGLQPEPDAAVESFVSVDGGATFAETDNPFGVDHGVDNLYAVGDAVIAVVRPTTFSATEPTPVTLWRTTDGVSWDKAEDMPAMDVVMAVGSTGGKLAAIGQFLTTPVIAVSEDSGITWRAVDISATLPGVGVNDSRWITAASIGPMGAFVNIQTWVQNAGVNQQGMQVDQFLASSDLVSWSVTASSELASGGLFQLLAGDDQVLLQGYQMNGGRVTLLGSKES
jgi:hypothetical protein